MMKPMLFEKVKLIWSVTENTLKHVRASYLNLSSVQCHLGKVMILAPMTLLTLYLLIFSQPRYLSESKIAIKQSNDVSGSNLNVGLLLGAGNPSSAEDALYLKEYINSPDILGVLDKQLNFRQAFGQSGWDFSTICLVMRPESNFLIIIVTVFLWHMTTKRVC